MRQACSSYLLVLAALIAKIQRQQKYTKIEWDLSTAAVAFTQVREAPPIVDIFRYEVEFSFHIRRASGGPSHNAASCWKLGDKYICEPELIGVGFRIA